MNFFSLRLLPYAILITNRLHKDHKKHAKTSIIRSVQWAWRRGLAKLANGEVNVERREGVVLLGLD
jgi:hypothetical protein